MSSRQPAAQESTEIEDGTGARFTIEKGHDCYADSACCGDCGTHRGCRCGDDTFEGWGR